MFSKNQNIEMSIGTFSMRRIRPYGHIWFKIEVFADLGGLGILPYFIPFIYAVGPVWGLTLGSYYAALLAQLWVGTWVSHYLVCAVHLLKHKDS